MKVLIHTVGSRGDVQPFVALGKGLQAAGHSVTICTCSSFEPFIKEHGLDYGYLSNDLLDVLDTDAGKDVIENTYNIFGVLKSHYDLWNEGMRINEKNIYEAWEVSKSVKPDLILFHPKCCEAPHAAEKLKIPACLVLPCPAMVATSEFPVIGLPDMGKMLNKATYGLIPSMVGGMFRKQVDEFRTKTLALDKSKQFSTMYDCEGQPWPVLHCVSEAVVPRPRDWYDDATINGYWFLETNNEDWTPPEDLKKFLDAGEKPVYVGFGSMVTSKETSKKFAKMAVQAIQETGVRGVLATGWGGLDATTNEEGGDETAIELPDTIYKLKQAPHDWLFPRMSAVIHHGGAGTTAAGLRAGCPTVIVPFIADQPFWGERVEKLGVGPPCIPHKKLTVPKLVDALRIVTSNEAMREKATSIGDTLRKEQGVTNTVAFLEELMAKKAKHTPTEES